MVIATVRGKPSASPLRLRRNCPGCLSSPARPAGRLLCGAALLAVLTAAPLTVAAQPPAPPAPPPDKPAAAQPAPSAGDDYRLQRALKIARDLLAKEQYTEALPLLQKLLESQHDRLLPAPAEPGPANQARISRSLKMEVRAILTTLPDAARRSYELQYGTTARLALEQALRTGGSSALEDVARRYPATRAGRRAGVLLATRLLDAGEPLSAAVWLERLRDEAPADSPLAPAQQLQLAICWFRAGHAERAREVLLPPPAAGAPALPEQQALRVLAWLKATVREGVRAVVSPDAGWWLHRGNASRNTAWHVAESHTAIVPRWPEQGVSLLTDATADPDHAAETAVSQRLQTSGQKLLNLYRRKTLNTLLPRSSPLVVGDVVLVRSFSTLSARHLHTGELLWESLPEATFESFALDGPEALTDPILEFMVRQRLLGDATYALLSSDGIAVYAVEDSGFARALNRPGKQGPVHLASTNRLVAFDLHNGRRLWEFDGTQEPAPGDPLPPPANRSGIYFHGPPLPLGQQLYAIGEQAGRIALFVLEGQPAATSHPPGTAQPGPRNDSTITIRWQQELEQTQQPLDTSPRRRLSGGTPSAAGEVLVCPTGNGSLVAVDLALRTLLWRYRVVKAAAKAPRQGFFRRAAQQPDSSRPILTVPTGWSGETVTLTDRHVLATVPGSGELLCLELRTGRVLWKAPREDSLFVAGVLDGHVVLTGERRVRCLALSDGQPVWKQPLEIPCPTGRGFIRNHVLYLPVPENAILLVDTRTGQRIRLAGIPGNLPPGNLVGTRGVLLSSDGGRLLAMPLPPSAIPQPAPPAP